MTTALRVVRVAITAVVLALLVVLVAGRVVARDASSADPADEPVLRADRGGGALRIVALGDSYMSGEGAGTFFRGTDRGRSDACRRAPTAYPVRVARALAARPPARYDGACLTFVACSGARTWNIGDAFRNPAFALARRTAPSRSRSSRCDATPTPTSCSSASGATTQGSPTWC